MKRILNILLAVATVAGVVSCHEQYTSYEGNEYLMFADTLSTNMVLADGRLFLFIYVVDVIQQNEDQTDNSQYITEF